MSSMIGTLVATRCYHVDDRVIPMEEAWRSRKPRVVCHGCIGIGDGWVINKCYVICNAVTGKSRNFGFVTFKDKKSMRDAIKEMNGRKLDGSRVDPKDVKFECFVGNLPDGTKENDLLRAFSLFGEIVYDTETNKSRRFGFVTFKDEESMRNAIEELDSSEFMDYVSGLKLDAARIIYGDEDNGWNISVKKSNRSCPRVITVKEAWPHKPSLAERQRSFTEFLITLT